MNTPKPPNRGFVSIQPATRWSDALPSGNGVVGAMVYGHIRQDVVLLNHESAFLPVNLQRDVPDISPHLPELRAAFFAGRWSEGAAWAKRLHDAGYRRAIDPYHPVGDLVVEMRHPARSFANYRRQVDFETGEATVTWREGETLFARRLFVSRADDAVVFEMAANRPGAVSCKLFLRPHDFESFHGFGTSQVVRPPDVPVEARAASAPGWLSLDGGYRDREGGFGARARVVAMGGAMQALPDCSLVVDGADRVLVLLDVFAGAAAAVADAARRRRLDALVSDYGVLLARHAALHAELFNRCRLSLGDDDLPATERLLLDANDTPPGPEAIRLLHDMGRYLLIGSCRPGSLPPNLQGKWNGDWSPAWASDYHNDENIQMNYWQALPGNLAELVVPYAEYYARFLDDYRTNARRVYGCRGILAPIAQTTDGLIQAGEWMAWTAGAGWLAQLLYEHWLFTGDRDFLARYTVPFLREVALFYEDFLVEGADGQLHFIPSLSPENHPPVDGIWLVTMDATMDIAVAREVLANLCAACRELGVHADDLPRWERLRQRLPAYRVNADGAFAEWLAPDFPDEYAHRHLSHIYSFFPGLEITPESDPEWFAAIRTAVEKRLVVGLEAQTGWSLAHLANIWARLGEGERALECLRYLLRSCTGPNLLTYHNDWRAQGLTMFWGHRARPPFQIDAVFGAAAAVLEMLVYSTPGTIRLLPALPASWQTGAIRGVRCRGGVGLDLSWDAEEGRAEVVLRCSQAQSVTLKVPGAVARFSGAPSHPSPHGPAHIEVALPAGQTSASIRWER